MRDANKQLKEKLRITSELAKLDNIRKQNGKLSAEQQVQYDEYQK